jgi:hypothetical protein
MIRLLVASSEVQVNHTEAFDSAATPIDTRYGTVPGGQTLKRKVLPREEDYSLKPVPEKTRPHGFEQKQGNAIWFANL